MELKENDKNYRTFLNIEMGATWKGIVLSLITLICAYPLLKYKLQLFLPDDLLERQLTIWWLSIFYWIMLPVICIIVLYSAISVFQERRMYFLPALIFSFGTLLGTLIISFLS